MTNTPAKRSARKSAAPTPAASKRTTAKSTATASSKRADAALARVAETRAAADAASKSTSDESDATVIELPKRESKRTTARKSAAAAASKSVKSGARAHGVKFATHVHPETYQASDSLDVRKLQLHTSWAYCDESACTWSAQTDAARANDAALAVELRKEIAASKRAPKAERAPKWHETDAAHELIALYSAHVAAESAFELTVCELIAAGVSPSHIGAAVGLGNSSVRRIVMRREGQTS